MPDEKNEFSTSMHIEKIIEMILSGSGYITVENVEKLDTIVDALGWKPKEWSEEDKKTFPDKNGPKYSGMGTTQLFYIDLALAKFKLLYKIIHEKLGEVGVVGGTEVFEDDIIDKIEVVENKEEVKEDGRS